MEFEINKNLKKDVHKRIAKENGSVKILNKIAVIFLMFGLLGGILLKSLFLIMFGPALFVCIKFGAIRLASRDAEERMNESLLFDEGIINYSFRTKFHSSPMSRVLISIPLDKLQKIEFDESLRKIVFYGRISSDYIDDIMEYKGEIPNAGNLREFVIYDYYFPSLMSELGELQNLVTK